MEIIVLVIIAGISAGTGAYIARKKQKSTRVEETISDRVQEVHETQETKEIPLVREETMVVSQSPTVAESNAMVMEARARAREIIIEAKDQALRIKTSSEEEFRRMKEKFIEVEKKLTYQKAQIEAKEKDLEQKFRSVKQSKEDVDKKHEQLNALINKQQEEFQKIASMSKDEARQQLITKVDRELAEEKGKRIRENEEEIKREAEKTAREILVSTMRFAVSDYIVEYTTSKVKLPDDEMKGRIIGKEGRNIRTFEELTGVNLDMDSSPGEVIISSFDPVRREIAKVSLERLITDGRIQPAHIEEVVEKTKNEIENLMFKEGDNLCHKVGAYNVPKDLIQMLGRFKYRFSYGQNMIEHTLEETRLGVAIAHELGANVEVVRLGCLFHDIGKVVTDDEGTHISLGVDLLRKNKIAEEVVNCVGEHHEDKPFSSIESAIVNLSDHVSGARPGARSEDYEAYVKRLKDLEEAALSFDGVEKVYAVSAGREVRVFVSPEKVDDASTAYLAREIAKKIELEQTYPGVVKVTVIRQTRVTETAK